jgi:hypothetical protein
MLRVLVVLGLLTTRAVSKQGKLVWATQESPEKCERRAADGDTVFVHFTGRLENGGRWGKRFCMPTRR